MLYLQDFFVQMSWVSEQNYLSWKRSNSAICLFFESQNHIFSISRIEMIQSWIVFCFWCISLSKGFQKGNLGGAWTLNPALLPPTPGSTRLPRALLSVSAHPFWNSQGTGFTSLGLFSPLDPGLVILQYFIISDSFCMFPRFSNYPDYLANSWVRSILIIWWYTRKLTSELFFLFDEWQLGLNYLHNDYCI